MVDDEIQMDEFIDEMTAMVEKAMQLTLNAFAVMVVEEPQLFVCGHSHILKVMYDRQLCCLHMNPGASGLYGFQPKRTMLRFDIDGKNIKNLEVWEKDRK